MTDSNSLIRVMQKVQPDEVYNLAAQSHVGVSFEQPEFTANTDALGTLRLLEAVRTLGMEEPARFYQASSSELFGLIQEFRRRRHVILSAFPLCGCEALCSLDYGKLSRSVRYVRQQRDLFQP